VLSAIGKDTARCVKARLGKQHAPYICRALQLDIVEVSTVRDGRVSGFFVS
jgi:hypothetical protein